MKKNYKLFAFVILLLMSANFYGQDSILYVGSKNNIIDSFLMDALKQNEFKIAYIDAAIYKTAQYKEASAYTNYKAIFISESVGSGDVVNFKTAGFPIPCVTTEGYAVRSNRFGWLTVDSTQFIQLSNEDSSKGVESIIIKNEDHYIVSKYKMDDKIAWSSYPLLKDMGVTGFKLNEEISNAIPLAVIDVDLMTDFPTLWTIPKGSTFNSDPAIILPNMVIFGAIGTGLGKYATEDYNDIIIKSLQWVTGEEVVNISSNSLKNNINVWPNPTNGLFNISITLPASGSVCVSIYDIEGRLIETNNLKMNAGYNTINLDLSNKANAYYIFEVITATGVLKGKICKNQ